MYKRKLADIVVRLRVNIGGSCTEMRSLIFFTQLSLLYFLLPRCAGTWYFYVELKSFNNPGNQDHDGGCCDIDCGNSCENYFVICLRTPNHNEQSNSCPLLSFSTASDPIGGTSYIEFSTGNDALPGDHDNPLRFSGTTWPGGFQLKVRALDADHDANDLIDYWIINRPTFLPTNNWTDFTTYYGETSNNAQFTLRYRLKCGSTWYGAQCNVRCRNEDTDTAHLMCDFDGNHVCMDGWTDISTDCTVPICQEGCNPDGGSCSNPGECECDSGWSGDLCDECSPLEGCEHGNCTSPGECICEEGYEGTLCNIDTDPCGHQTPCVHGNCTNIGGGQYTCSCDVGFTGPNCDTDIDECTLSPCLNGATCENCIHNNSVCPLGYRCHCPPGYHGHDCGLDIDHCTPDPCMNGGTCHDGLLNSTCECPPGYTGANCEEEFDYCDEMQPCLNGGTCTNLKTEELFTCECPSLYEGPICKDERPDRQPCGDDFCKEGEICLADVDGVDVFKCVLCENGPDDCEEIAAQTDNEDKNKSNIPLIVGVTVAAVVFLLVVALLIILCCCCRSLICPCLGRDKVEENDTGPGTLSGPNNNVSYNAMYFSPDTLASQKGGTLLPKNGTLPRSDAMQNPMYAIPGGIKTDSLSKAPLQFGSNDVVQHSSPAEYEHPAPQEKTQQLKDENHYEELEPLQAGRGSVAPEYQKLSEVGQGGVLSSSGPYASLYKTPSVPSNSLPPPPPSNPPQYLPLMGTTRPENPYTVDPSTPAQTPLEKTDTTPNSPTQTPLEKTDTTPKDDDERLLDLKLTEQ